MQAAFELIDRIRSANSIRDINASLEKLAYIIEFEYFLLGVASPKSITKTEQFVVDNYPKEWRKQYDHENLVHLDPVVQYSHMNHSPIIWSNLDKNAYKKNQIEVLKKAQSAGLVSGFSIPIHGAVGEFGMISFALSSDTEMDRRKFADAIPLVQLVTPVLQDALKRINAGSSESSVQLTKREKECLTWATEGKSSWEISQILGCSERTVIFHLTNAGNKLDSSNRYQAISKAILLGVIQPTL